MIFAAGFFTESMGFDISVLSALGTILAAVCAGFGWVIKVLRDQKKTRAEEIKNVVSSIINASPNKVVVDPQPLLIKIEQESVKRQEIDEIKRRVSQLEIWRDLDRKDLGDKIDSIPGKVFAMLKDMKGIVGK